MTLGPIRYINAPDLPELLKKYGDEFARRREDYAVQAIPQHFKCPVIRHFLHDDGDAVRCTIQITERGDTRTLNLPIPTFNALPLWEGK